MHSRLFSKLQLTLLCVMSVFSTLNALDRFKTPPMSKMRASVMEEYANERTSLTQAEIDDILDRGYSLLEQSTLTNTLIEGGSALFPHTYITKCGDQVAAVALAVLEACQKSGKKQVLALGVLHSLTDTTTKARLLELSGGDLSNEPCRGIFAPGLPYEEILSEEYFLDNFIFLFEHAAKRLGIKPPKLIVRYPNLTAGSPETLPGMEELRQIAEGSIIVATADLCHHGVAYMKPLAEALPISDKALTFAKDEIEGGFPLLSSQNLLDYRNYCVLHISDSKEIGQILNTLLGGLNGHIVDLRLVDVSILFENRPEPSWVAATLVELKSNKIK